MRRAQERKQTWSESYHERGYAVDFPVRACSFAVGFLDFIVPSALEGRSGTLSRFIARVHFTLHERLALVHNRTQIMDFEWDPAKAQQNVRKHGVQFADAVSVLEDENALTMSEHAADGEHRFVTLGVDAFGRLLVVVYTWRRDRVRIISARKATPSERKRYAGEL